MAEMKQLRMALEMITGGSDAPVPEKLRAQALEVHRASTPWTMGKGIQGVGIAEKTTDGERLRELVLKVYVEEKLPKSKVDNLVPRSVKIPGVAERMPTDVESIGRVKLEVNSTRVRPAIPGFSVGHFNITAGTIGCLVRKIGDPKTLYILSNSHVLADEGVATVGDQVLQPGPIDGGTQAGDVLGTLAEFVPFNFTATGYPNLVDAAIAKVKASDVTSAIRLIGVPAGVSKVLRRGIQVQKTGRTTDYTRGVIQDVDYRMALDYKRPGGGNGRVGLRDLVLCTRYTDGGDSGSAVLNMDKKVVGLHFAGSDSSSIFNKIGNVLDALKIELVTETI